MESGINLHCVQEICSGFVLGADTSTPFELISAINAQGNKFHRIVKGFVCQGGDVVRGTICLLDVH